MGKMIVTQQNYKYMMDKIEVEDKAG